jgi:hypothetical protein
MDHIALFINGSADAPPPPFHSATSYQDADGIATRVTLLVTLVMVRVGMLATLSHP